MAGVNWSMPKKLVKNTLQPPLSTGALLVRRWITLPQSVLTTSMFMPACFSMSAPTWPRAASDVRSVATSTTVRSPL